MFIDALSSFSVANVAPIQFLDVPFSIRVTARKAVNGVYGGFTDEVSVATIPTSVLLTPTNAGPFSKGVRFVAFL